MMLVSPSSGYGVGYSYKDILVTIILSTSNEPYSAPGAILRT